MSHPFILAPSLLNADFSRLGETMDVLKSSGCEALHMDVMDGAFVPNISFGQAVIGPLSKKSPLPMDVHLMVEEPGRFIEDFARGNDNVSSILVHPEACRHLDRVLQQIREQGKKAGVALNPATPLEGLEWVFDKVDAILIMSVNPGFGGQKFIEAMLPKIAAARLMIEKSGREVTLAVDGGVNDTTAFDVVKAGADYLVVGSFLFKKKNEDIPPEDIPPRVEKIREIGLGRRPQEPRETAGASGC